MADVLLKDITKYFGDHKIIDQLNLHVNAGEFVTLLGPSGCGKTTLLKMIAGLEPIDKGEIFIGGKRYNNVPAQKRSISMVFQSYALFPHMNVRNNVLFGLRIKKIPEYEMFEKLQWVIPLLGLEGLENRLPKEISGGQRQRVALARALVLDPQVLLLDEPLSNLDAALRDMAMEELKRIHQSVGKTIIYVTHNQAEAMSMSERIALINAGSLEQCDTPNALYEQPKTLFSAEFIGSPSANMYDGRIVKENENVLLDTEIGSLKLDKDRASDVSSIIGKGVRVCIRPQNIQFVQHFKPRRQSDTELTLTIELVVSMGDRVLVIGRNAQNIVARLLVDRDDKVTVGDEITVVVDGRRIHLFSLETKQNIFAV
jgi:multiple sugar transport system ATP-binding protein